MDRIITIYLKLLPILGLIGIFLSTLRTTEESRAGIYLLIFSAILDFIIIILKIKKLIRPLIFFVLLLLLISVFVGLFNNVDISRRYITDVTNPLFFFCKIIIFKYYWRVADFSEYIKYYTKIAFWGSILLLPITYIQFKNAGVNRIAIFPPLELPFVYYLQNNSFFLLISLILILLYGKRTQLVCAVGTFIAFIFLYKKKQLIKFSMLGIFGIFALGTILHKFKENNAVKRLLFTYDKITESTSIEESLSYVSAGRDKELYSVFKLMENGWDYFFGLGVGFTYNRGFSSDEAVSNVHFSPVSFLSKYGLIFTVFLYLYLLKSLVSFNKSHLDKSYIIAYSLFFFIFLESFFSYSLFVTPLAAVSIGYIKYKNEI